MNPLFELKALGQHVWLDMPSRVLLRDGGLQRLVNEDGIDGVTFNPSNFQKPIAGEAFRREDSGRLDDSTLTAEARYEALLIPDVQAACDVLLPAYVSSGGASGYVNLAVSPLLARDQAGIQAAAFRLRRAVERDNLLIKVPATPAGVLAFEQLTATGVRVNANLIFSLAQYEAVAQAYLRGAMHWLASGGTAGHLRSVASLGVSRVDTLLDQRLERIGTPHSLVLRGRSGVALAKCCHGRYREILQGPAFALLKEAGVRPQTLLWASTGNKDTAGSDVPYVESLIGPDTIAAVTGGTLAAFRDHGRAMSTLESDMAGAQDHMVALAALGIDCVALGERLQGEGVRECSTAYEAMLKLCV